MINPNFFKKELKEAIKTPRLMILIFLFLFFALMSPLLARYINELLALLASDIPIQLPTPTANDAWLQFYKNTTSICLIVYLIIVTGLVSQEKNKGSIVLVLTKKVSRLNFLFSKFVASSLIFTLCYLISILVSGYYTKILFGDVFYEGLGMSLILLWLAGIFFTALGIFVSVIGKTPTTSALFGFVGYAVFNVVNISKDLATYNPAGGLSLVNLIIQGVVSVNDQWINLVSTILGIVIIFSLSYFIFKKQEI